MTSSASAPVAADRNALTRHIGRAITILTVVLTLAAAGLLSFHTHGLVEAQLRPELEKQSATIAEFAASDVERALGYGIPLPELRGVETYFDEARAPHPEVDFIALLDREGGLLHLSGSSFPQNGQPQLVEAIRTLLASDQPPRTFAHPALGNLVLAPARHEGRIAAIVAVGTDPYFVDNAMQELSYDVLVILLVAVFLALEISAAILSGVVVGPLSGLIMLLKRVSNGDLRTSTARDSRHEIGRAVSHANTVLGALQARYTTLTQRSDATPAPELAQRLKAFGARFGLNRGMSGRDEAVSSPADMRLALFLMVGAEEMQKAFMPLYVASLEDNLIEWLSPQVLIGLPISVYMFAVAVFTPFAGTWSDRFGPRRIFLLGLVPAALGFLGCALASGVLQLVSFRILTAIGYAMCTIAAQGFIMSHMPPRQRAQGAAIFVGVTMAASICGTAIGGILADRVGYRAVFGCAAMLCVVASFLAWRMMPAGRPGQGGPRRALRFSDVRMMLANPRFLALLMFSAIPAKIVLTGFLFYAVPIYLTELKATEAEIGRVMILYSLVIILAGPWLSRLATSPGRSWALVIGGAILSGLATCLLLLGQEIAVVVLCVLVVGIAHAMSISPQIGLVPDVCRKEVDLIGETAILGVFRMLERVGSVIGPILVATLVLRFGMVEGLAWTGAAIVAMALLLLATLIRAPEPGGRQ